MQAVAVLAALHPAPITDLAWSCDGATLAASSKDGYCSMTAFSPNELGVPPAKGVVPPHIQHRLLSAAKAVPPRWVACLNCNIRPESQINRIRKNM